MFSESKRIVSGGMIVVLAIVGLAAGAIVHQDLRDKAAADEKRLAVENIADHLIDRMTQPRTWSDPTGKYRCEATLLGASDSAVQLKKASGELVNTPIGRLSDADRRYVSDACHGERVTLPHDENAWRLTVIFSSGWTQQIPAWFDSDAGLKKYKSQTLFDAYSVNDPLYREKLRYWVGAEQCGVVLQQPNGQCVFKATDARLPQTPEQLSAAISEALAVYSNMRNWAIEGRPCPICPRPEPQPAPVTPPVLPLVPDTIPQPAPPAAVAAKNDSGNFLSALVCGAAGLLGGLFHYLKQDVKSLFA